MEGNRMSVLTSYFIGLLTCTVISLAFSFKESWGDTYARLGINYIFYSIVFLILFSLGVYN